MCAAAKSRIKRWKDNEEAEVLSIRHVLSSAKDKCLPKDELIRQVAIELGYKPMGRSTRQYLYGYLRSAARRRILYTRAGICYLNYGSIKDYDRDELKPLFLSAIESGLWDRTEAIDQAARYLGFARTGAVIEAQFKSIITGLLKQKQMTVSGNYIRKKKKYKDPIYRPQKIQYTQVKSLQGRCVTFTGRLPGLVRWNAMRRLKKFGSMPSYNVQRDTDILVVGEESSRWKYTDASRKIAKAQRMNRKGEANIKFITAERFLALVKYRGVV